MHVSRPVAIAFTVALVAALMGVAYLLGLDHARRHQIIEQPPPNPTVSMPSEFAPGPTVAAAPVAAPPAPAMPSAVIEQATASAVVAPAATPTPSSPPVHSPEADAVRNYFQQMDLLAGVNPFGDDAAGAAQQLLASAMGGDSSGFDAIAKVATTAVTKAQAIVPPAVCAHYHAELVKSLEESVQMLATMKAAMTKQDTNALMAVASNASQMKSRLDALTSEASAIKAKLGLR